MPVTYLKNLDLPQIRKPQYTNMNINTSSSTPKMGKDRKTTASFPVKLYRMLSEVEKDGKQSIVTWNPDGRTLQVLNHKKFVSEILPNYFKQSKYKSFQRQLNFYGFQRVSHGPLEGAYGHPKFVRGNEEQVKQISRLTQIVQSNHKKVKVNDSDSVKEDVENVKILLNEEIPEDRLLHLMGTEETTEIHSGDNEEIPEDIITDFEIEEIFGSLRRHSFVGERSVPQLSTIALIKLQDSRRGSTVDGTRLSFSGKTFRFVAADFH